MSPKHQHCICAECQDDAERRKTDAASAERRRIVKAVNALRPQGCRETLGSRGYNAAIDAVLEAIWRSPRRKARS